jgi:GAF domain
VRPFLEKVAADTREYVQSLLEENQRLSNLVAELDNRNREFADRFIEIEQQNTNLANLYVASYQLNGTLERDRIVAAIQEIVINLIGSEELGIWQIDDELDALNLIGSFGINAREWAGVPLGSGIVGHVGNTGESYIASESEARPVGREQHLTACIPLKLDDKVIGVIGIFRLLQQKQGLEPLDFELFDLLCSHAATALFCTREAAQ